MLAPPITCGLVIYGSCSNAGLFYSLECRPHCRSTRILFNLPKDMRSLDHDASWHPLSCNYKAYTYSAFYNRLFYSKECSRVSIFGECSRVLLTVPRFNTNYGKNSISCDNGFSALNSKWGKRVFERPNWLDDCAWGTISSDQLACCGRGTCHWFQRLHKCILRNFA